MNPWKNMDDHVRHGESNINCFITMGTNNVKYHKYVNSPPPPPRRLEFAEKRKKKECQKNFKSKQIWIKSRQYLDIKVWILQLQKRHFSENAPEKHIFPYSYDHLISIRSNNTFHWESEQKIQYIFKVLERKQVSIRCQDKLEIGLNELVTYLL